MNPFKILRKTDRDIVLVSAIGVAALLVLGLVLAFTRISVDSEWREQRAHAQSEASALAARVANQFDAELSLTEETLSWLAAQWRQDPLHFSLTAFRDGTRMGASKSREVLYLDAAGRVVDATRRDLIGRSFADDPQFQEGARGRASGLSTPSGHPWTFQGRWRVEEHYWLRSPSGAFAGMLLEDSDAWCSVGKLLQPRDLARSSFAGIVAPGGVLRVLARNASSEREVDVKSWPLAIAARAQDDGVWIGRSPQDGVERVHAFRRIPGADLYIVAGLDAHRALHDAEIWSTTAEWFAAGMVSAVLVLAALLVREVREARQREQRLGRDRAALWAANAEAEAAQANAEAKTAQLEGIVTNMTDGVMLLDADMRLVMWNDRFPQYSGTPPEVLRPGMPIEQVIRARVVAGEYGNLQDEAAIEAIVRKRLDELSQTEGFWERVVPGAVGQTIEFRRSRLPNGGLVTVYTDISTHKKAEETQVEARREAETVAAQKSSFVATVSHEIRTPLNAVLGSLALLERSRLTQGQQTLVRTARQAGDALLDLMNDVLDLSQVEAGRLVLRPGAVKVREMLSAVADVFQGAASARSLMLRVEVAHNVPPHVELDGVRLRQILMNFLSNATKFSSPGEIVVTVNALETSGAHLLRFSVTDPGPPIAEKDISRLFQPFTRLVDARVSGVAGTGLGLAICERLTRLMGGSIGVSRAPSGGNEFWVALPLVVAQPEQESSGPSTLPRPPRTRILVVEDVRASALVIALLLRREGHYVDTASSGQEALALIETVPYDLVFMDLIMPGMSGLEVTRHIRSLAGAAGAVPIVALTATTSEDDQESCRTAGMDGVLAKPARLEEMQAVIVRVRAGQTRVEARAFARALAVSSAHPIVDEARLAELRSALSASTFDTLLDQCFEDIEARAPKLREAIHAAQLTGQGRTVSEESHAMAGIAATYGFANLEMCLRAVMGAARAGKVQDAARLAEDVESKIAEARTALAALRGTEPAESAVRTPALIA